MCVRKQRGEEGGGAYSEQKGASSHGRIYSHIVLINKKIWTAKENYKGVRIEWLSFPE